MERRTQALLLQLMMIVSRPLEFSSLMCRAASSAAAFQPCGGLLWKLGGIGGQINGNKVRDQLRLRVRTSSFVGGTPLDISEQEKMTEGWIGGVKSKRGLTASSDQPDATQKDDDGEGGGGRVDMTLQSGTQPGFFIVNRLTVPHPLPPSALQNEKESREVMSQKPRKQENKSRIRQPERLITGHVCRRAGEYPSRWRFFPAFPIASRA